MTLTRILTLASLAAGTSSLGLDLAALAQAPVASMSSPITLTLTRTNHWGWHNSFRIANRAAEILVVPAIGRVMQFRFLGTDGPFWENPALHGQAPDPASAEWGNFGGDKSWPAPQADWPKLTPRAWPPPVAFDSMPVEATIESNTLVLTSPIDPHFGIRTRRRIDLDPVAPVMRIRTEYEKVAGEPVRVSVWVITQLKDPVRVFVPVPQDSRFPNGYLNQSAANPLDLQVTNSLVSLKRDPRRGEKIGNDAGALLWVGENEMLLVECPRGPEADYPDGGASAEVWTNPDPLPYIELETLGPLATMKPGDRLARTNTYTLLRRASHDLDAEARRVLGVPR
ncbi:MAG: DUF4380 domain-containing protein [Limisphaerales bacterium]